MGTLHTYRAAGASAAQGQTTEPSVPLVLLHGFPLDHRMWDDVVPHLPGRHAVLAVDLPGSAPAGTADLSEPSIEAAADAVAAVLAGAGVTEAVVAGLSMGGYVALALAERRPDLVAGLGLLDTRSTADTTEARENRLRVAAAVESAGTVDEVRPMAEGLLGETTRVAHPETAERLARWIDEQPPAGVAWSQRAMASRPDRTEVLGAFDGPVLVLVGDEDVVTPVEAAEHMVAAAGDPRLVVVPHAGHMSAVEQPAAVAAALADLVEHVHVTLGPTP